jgi:hypothetical protein
MSKAPTLTPANIDELLRFLPHPIYTEDDQRFFGKFPAAPLAED